MTMDLPLSLFGVHYNRHEVEHLENFIKAASRPFKSGLSKRVLYTDLVRFERSLSTPDRAMLAFHVGRFYDTRDTPVAPFAEGDLYRALRNLGRGRHGNYDEIANRNSRSGSQQAPIIGTIVSQKRKRSEMSRGTRIKDSGVQVDRSKSKSKSKSKSNICSVCYEKFPIESFPEFGITENCKHANHVCTVCVRAHINVRIEIGQFGFMNCPVCPETLALEDVYRLCKADTFERYDRLVARSAIENDPTFHFCLHGCGSGQYVIGNSSKMKCGFCEKSTCIQHAIPWHDNLTCEEYDQEYGVDSEDSSIESLVQPKAIEGFVASERSKKVIEDEASMKKEKAKRARALKYKVLKRGISRKNAEREKAQSEMAERKTVQREEAERQKAERERIESERFEMRQAQRKEAQRKEAETQKARRQEAARLKALSDARALKHKRAKDNKASQMTVNRISKTCPNKNCGASIQKTGGCNYMRCTRCRQEFCWRCMQAWFGDHLNICVNPYYARRRT